MPMLYILVESLNMTFDPAESLPVFVAQDLDAVKAVRARRAEGVARLKRTGEALVPALQAHLDDRYPEPDGVTISTDLRDTDRPEVVETVDAWLADQGWQDPEARAAAIAALQAGAFGAKGRFNGVEGFNAVEVACTVYTLPCGAAPRRTLLDHDRAIEASSEETG